MRNISAVADGINPCGIYAYLDKVHIWLSRPLSQGQLDWLKQQCGGMHVDHQPKRWDRIYQQRLQLQRPNREALQSLSTLMGGRLNYVEFGLDWIFDDEEERDQAFALVSRYHVKRWHGKQRITFAKTTRYTGQRRAPNVLASYADKASRITREPYCVHLEWRINGVEPLRRAGITCIRDLMNFDHRHFWQSRLLMRAFNPGELGKQFNIHVAGKGRRRTQWIKFHGAFAYDYDLRAGGILVRAQSSTQMLIDTYGKRFPVNRCLIEINVRHLLPNQTLSYDYASKRSLTSLSTLAPKEFTGNPTGIFKQPFTYRLNGVKAHIKRMIFYDPDISIDEIDVRLQCRGFRYRHAS